MDAREGCRLLCEQALPDFDANADDRMVTADGKRPPFWLLGSTMVLGKDRTLTELSKWHSNLIMPMINRWVSDVARVVCVSGGARAFVRA